MKKFDLGNGDTLVIEKADRGLADDYKVTFLEDGKPLFGSEYYSAEAIEWQYDIKL